VNPDRYGCEGPASFVPAGRSRDSEGIVPKELHDALETYSGALAGTERLLRTLRGDGLFAVESAESIVEALLAQLEVNDALVAPFLGARGRASSPAADAVGLCILSLLIGIQLDYPRPVLGRLGLSALLGAIGRARGPRGSDATESAPASARGRTSEEHTHVVGLATAYHSLTRQRADDRAWPPADLKELLQRQRARFPDRLLKALIRVLTTLPLGALVRLNNGEIGYVVAKNEKFPLRPVVAVWSSLGKLLAEPKPVDLRSHPFLYVKEFLGDTKLGETADMLP
jgi:hypothetical protein